MPYITKEQRALLDARDEYPENAGELNYMLTKQIINYQDRMGLSYQVINDIIGALDNCKSEYYRRVAEPYENQKIIMNGDVYE